jgi:hypothetical protein
MEREVEKARGKRRVGRSRCVRLTESRGEKSGWVIPQEPRTRASLSCQLTTCLKNYHLPCIHTRLVARHSIVLSCAVACAFPFTKVEYDGLYRSSPRHLRPRE